MPKQGCSYRKNFHFGMPTITVSRRELLDNLGVQMTDEEVDDLCFQFGIELDEIVRDHAPTHEGTGGDVKYKIDIPANRYDLLCLKGLVTALDCFLNKKGPNVPEVKRGAVRLYKELSAPSQRKYISAAIIKNAALTEATYRDLIEFQEKLHQSIGQNRTLVSIGTHDYDKTEPPYHYALQQLEDVRFVPLNQTREYCGNELSDLYKHDPKLRVYLEYDKEEKGHPVLYDDNGSILSLPPVINSDFSKIHPGTRNVLVEVTGTDLTRVHTALFLLVAHFGAGTDVEAIQVIEGGVELGNAFADRREFLLTVSDVRKELKLELSASAAKSHLERMMHRVECVEDGGEWRLKVAPGLLRSDVLHVCDLIEDIAISYGYNNFERLLPEFYTVGRETPLNSYTDKLRVECALVGFSEVFTMALLSSEENSLYGWLTSPGIILKNPKSLECTAVRTNLISSVLKCVAANQHYQTPIKLFEVSDICLVDHEDDTGARNERRLCMLIASKTSGLEDLQEAFDVVMKRMGIRNLSYEEKNVPPYLQERSCVIKVGDSGIGHLGIVDPEVLLRMKIPHVCSCVEIRVPG